MSCCSTKSCESGSCGKVCGMITGILRIALGAAWVYFGVSKFGADAATMDTLGGAATGLFPFLGFLSNTIWFWIAALGEIIVGLFLLSGCRKLVKCAAVISLIILVFITDFSGGRELKTVVLAAVATMIVKCGGGSFVLCPMPCCKDGTCNTGSCSTGSCNKDEEIIEA